MKKTTTIFEISKRLSLSPSTVSRALKNHPDIAPTTKQKVLDLANELDYEPNIHAVGLRTSSSMEIAVIVPNLSGFFYDSFISSIEKEARQQGYSLIILVSGDNPQVEKENLKICRQRRVDGVLMCITPSTTDEGQFNKLKSLGIPLIFFDKVPIGSEYYNICVADEQAAQLAAQKLIAADKKRILGIFGNTSLSITKVRLEAFESLFNKFRKDQELTLEFADSSEAATNVILSAFQHATFDAVFCMSDEILVGVMKALQTLKVSIPEETGVIAISNGFFPKLYYPEITYVETSGAKLGKMAFFNLIALVQDQNIPVGNIVPSVLVEGGSL